MKRSPLWAALALAATLALFPTAALQATPPEPEPVPQRQIPDVLKPWQSWALWNDLDRNCPRPYNDAKKPLCFWPSKLTLDAAQSGGRFTLSVNVYAETWVPLPGGDRLWPQEVKANGAPVAVVEHDGHPAVELQAGTWTLEGVFPWTDIPQQLDLPREIGLLALTLEGKPVETPLWDASGQLWLKRNAAAGETDKDYLSAKLNALLEDGIPLWLRTQVELIVSGKNREETFGTVVPEGWNIASVESPIPVAITDAGQMKAQVRPGKWTVTINAFRIDNPSTFRYAPGATPAVKEELIAFKASPIFRMVDITGPAPVDVSQTTFPGPWRAHPVYRWNTATAFGIHERLRGMGDQKPPGLNIERNWWLDDHGGGITFRDHISAAMQRLWRLDAAPGTELGSVRSGGQGQLITRNPQNGAPGVELRTRSLDLNATGRVPLATSLPAAGWQADADSLRVTLNLPPGWRLFALFGADWVNGDWLTAWTLLDLFLLLIFSLAVGRLWGPLAGVCAFLAFGLAYHEPGAPRYAWLVLLIPLALLRYVREDRGRRLLVVWKWLTVAALVLGLAPFVAQQLQQAIYPQLERTPWVAPNRAMAPTAPMALSVPAVTSSLHKSKGRMDKETYSSSAATSGRASEAETSNLAQDAKARIQTGPGVPDWQWRTVTFGWNGPVSASQQVRPILIPGWLERALAVLRVALLLALAAILLNARRWAAPLVKMGKAGKAAALIIAFTTVFSGVSPAARAEIPSKDMLNTLHDRLTEVSSAYPNAANIPSATLTLQDRRVILEAEIDTAAPTAVPVPCRLAGWSPLTVLVDGKPEATLRRADGNLWVALTQGVHRLRVEGMLGDITEWEWTFQLKPRRVQINAPGWTVRGVRPDGTPEGQIFFSLNKKAAAVETAYDRQDYQPIVSVRREVEMGLVWQVRTTVDRLSAPGKAIALRIPLLPGENVLTSNAVMHDGFIEVRLGAQDKAFTWTSQLPITPKLRLATHTADTWVETWQLSVSPVWNVAFSGLAPVLPDVAPLVPVWNPWPGEAVEWSVSRPEAIQGATVTVEKTGHTVTLGNRQHTSTLELTVRSSLAGDFLVGLPPDAELTSIQAGGQALPVRRDNGKVVIPLKAGDQEIHLAWKRNAPLALRATADPVALPVESANARTEMNVPESRWVLWAFGPTMGPAVRFWGILAFSLLAACVLGRLPGSPLKTREWVLLALGLTQVPLPAALTVIAWFFILAWRGGQQARTLRTPAFSFLQTGLILLTAITLGILIAAVSAGLLGQPDMFIVGNGSGHDTLRWYQARCGTGLPEPGCYTVSIWWYRLLMLAWALWLASALIRWLRWAWEQFSAGGCFRKESGIVKPPPIP